MTDDIFANSLSPATTTVVQQTHIEHAEHSLPVNMDTEHAHTSTPDTTPPHSQAAAAAYAQQQQLSFAHRALGVGQPAGTGSSASTIRPEYMNAQAHVSTVDVNASPFAFAIPTAADAADGSVLPAPSYTPSAVQPRSSSLHGPVPSAFHHHHASHFSAPPVPPPRNSSLGHYSTPQSATSTMATVHSSTSPSRVPSLQLTHPTPTKRKPRTQPPSSASQATATVPDIGDVGEAAYEDDVTASHGMSSESSKDSVNDEDLSKEEIEVRRKARAREKGRIRQQRKRARDKQAKLEQEARKRAGLSSRNPSAPNLLQASSASSTYTNLPHSQSFYSLSPNNSFAFSSTTSLSGQSSPSIAFSPIVGTSGLYSPGYMTPNPDLYLGHGHGHDLDLFASAIGGSGGISFQPRSSRGKARPTLQMRRTSQMSSVSIDTTASTSMSMSVNSGPRTAPLPNVAMNPPPFKRRKSEPEPDDFRTGLGVMMTGPSQSWSVLSHTEPSDRPALQRNYSTDLSSTDVSETQLSDIELGEQTRSPTPPPISTVPNVSTAPASPGETFASLILSACTDAALADKLEKQLNLGKAAMDSLQSELAGVYDRWAAANHAKRPSIETTFPSASGSSSSASVFASSAPTTAATSVSTSPVAGPKHHHLPSGPWPVDIAQQQYNPVQQMGHIASRGGKQLSINLGMTDSPAKDDSPAHSALQTPNTGSAFGFHRGSETQTPARQPVAHSQTEPDMKRVSEGAWLRGQGMHGQAYGLESPLAMTKARKPNSRSGSHRSTQSQSTIRAPTQTPVSPSNQTFPLPSPRHEPIHGEGAGGAGPYPPGHTALYKHYGPPAPLAIYTTQSQDGVQYASNAQSPFTPSRQTRDAGLPAHFSPVTPSQRIVGGQIIYGPYSAPLFATPGHDIPVYPPPMMAHMGEHAGMLGAPLMPMPVTGMPLTGDFTTNDSGPSTH